jgi:hypothetical protein
MPAPLLVAEVAHWALSAILLALGGYLLIFTAATGFGALCAYEALVMSLAGAGFHWQRKIKGRSMAQALATESAAVSLGSIGLAVSLFADSGGAHGSLSDVGVLFAVVSFVFGLFGGGYYFTLWMEAKRAESQQIA